MHAKRNQTLDADVAIILGDRHEMLFAAHECIVHHVPYVHVGAGCVTRGAWDQTVRDMLTAGCSRAWAYTELAMNSSCYEQYCGDGDYNEEGGYEGYGVPILDTLKPRGLKRQDYVLVAINPVTAQNVGEEIALVDEIADACKVLRLDVVWSHPNEDPGNCELIRKLCDRFGYMNTLANRHKTFADAIEECRCIVGNSSSALIEAPVLGTPFVGCGCRQDGRPLAQGLSGIALHNAIANAKPHKGPSPYQHPNRDACGSIIKLCEEVARED